MYWFYPFLWVLLLGFLGQVILTGMFLIHCFFPERNGKHSVQMVFWILVLGGSLMLLVCAGYHQAPLFVAVQLLLVMGVLLYLWKFSKKWRLVEGNLSEVSSACWIRKYRCWKTVCFVLAAPLALLLVIELTLVHHLLWTPTDPRPTNLGNRPSNVAALPEKTTYDTVQFAVVGDVYSRFTTLARILRKMDTHSLDFLVLLGDITCLPLPECHRLLRAELADLDLPFPTFYVPGNHDIDRDNFTLTQWKKEYGPNQFRFKYGDNLFVFIHAPTQRKPWPTKAHKFLDNVLSRESGNTRRTFVFNHVPMSLGTGWSSRSIQEEKKLLNILRKHRVDYYIAGDYHGYALVSDRDTEFFASGGGGGDLSSKSLGFNHAIIFTVNRNRVQSCIVVVPGRTPIKDFLKLFVELYMLPIISGRVVWVVLGNVSILFLLLFAWKRTNTVIIYQD